MGHRKSKLASDPQVEKDYVTLTHGEIQYICRHTNLVDKEVCRRHDQFIKVAKDGCLTKEQFTNILQEIWPTGNVNDFANYLFDLCDKTKKGFLQFREFIILHCQLNTENVYLGYLFDMIDTRQKRSLPQEKIELLFASFFKLIGQPINEQCNTYISQQHITHLIDTVDKSQKKCLTRDQFINIANVTWMDKDNGIGTLLIEHSC